MNKSLITLLAASVLPIANSVAADNIIFSLNHGAVGRYETYVEASLHINLTPYDLSEVLSPLPKAWHDISKPSGGGSYSFSSASFDTGRQSYEERPGVRSAAGVSTCWANGNNLTMGAILTGEMLAPVEAGNNFYLHAYPNLDLKNLHFDHPILELDPHATLQLTVIFRMDMRWSISNETSGDGVGGFFTYRISNPFADSFDPGNPEVGIEASGYSTNPHELDSRLVRVNSRNAAVPRDHKLLTSKPIPINQYSVLDIYMGLVLASHLSRSNNMTANAGNTARLDNILWFDEEMNPIEPGTVKLGKDGPVVFANGKLVIHHTNETIPIFRGVMQGDWAHDSQAAAPDGSTTLSATIPEGASIVDAYLYSIVSGSDTDLPAKPVVNFDGETFEGSAFKVAARMPEQTANPKVAYRVNVLSEVAARDYDGGLAEFTVSGQAAEGTVIEDYRLVVVYRHDDAELRSIALFDGHVNGTYDLTTDSALTNTAQEFAADMLVGGESTSITIDGEVLNGSQGEISLSDQARLVPGQEGASITVAPDAEAFPYLFGFNVTTDTPLSLLLSGTAIEEEPDGEPEITDYLAMGETRTNAIGEVEIDVHSDPGAFISIDSSENLLEWEPLVSFFNEEGIVTLLDQTPDQEKQRFFRARFPDDIGDDVVDENF